MTETNQSETGFAPVNGARLYYQVAGQGHPLVLTHAGIANSRMWDDQFDVFAKHYRVVRYDVRGFGKSEKADGSFTTHGDLYEFLKYLKIERTSLLGVSMGGSISIDFTLEHPEMVSALIPVGSGLAGYDANSPETETLEKEMNAAYERHDLAQAVEISLQIWAAGPTRKLSDVAPAVLERIREMNAHTFALPEEDRPQPLDPPANARLGEIRAPTLVIVGDKDVSGIQDIANRLATGIPGARKVVIPNTAHMPNMEKPDEFNRIVLDFLKGKV